MKGLPPNLKWVIIAAIIIILVMIGRFIYGVNLALDKSDDLQRHVDTIVAIEKLMYQWDDEGYTVRQSRYGEVDPENPELKLYEWTVWDSEKDQLYVYTWSYDGPMEVNIGTFDSYEVLEKMDEYEVRPVSESAKLSHELVLEMLEEIDGRDRSAWLERHDGD